jgi:hypothetical protein
VCNGLSSFISAILLMLASFIFPAANICNVVLTTTSCSLVLVDVYGRHPEDGRNMYFRNVGTFPQGYTVP